MGKHSRRGVSNGTKNFPKAKKHLGQNFLHDPGILNRINSVFEQYSDSDWLEIGCGTGCMTRFLAEKSGALLGVELDDDLIGSLEQYFQRDDQFLIHASILDVIEEDCLESLKEQYQLVGNLPYYITSPILEHLLLNFVHFERLYIMVQREVANRIIAQPGSKDYSRLSLLCQSFLELEAKILVKAGCFQPPPKVDSMFLILKRKVNPMQGVLLDRFLEIVKLGFSQRRKKLAKLLSQGLSIPKTKIEEFLVESGVSADTRAEAVSLQKWIDLAQRLNASKI